MKETRSRKLRKEIVKIRSREARYEQALEAKQRDFEETKNTLSELTNERRQKLTELMRAENDEMLVPVADAVDIFLSFLETKNISLTDEEIDVLTSHVSTKSIHAGNVRNWDIPGHLVTYSAHKDGTHMCRPYDPDVDMKKQAHEMHIYPVSDERLFLILKHDQDNE